MANKNDAMTKKHYVMIAQAINAQKLEAEKFYDYKPAVIALKELSHVLAGKFKENNPLFDSKKFLNACGFPYNL